MIRRHFGSFLIGGTLGELRDEGVVIVAGEEEDGGAKMLVEIGLLGVVGQGAPLGVIGRHQQDLGIAAFHVGGKHGGDAAAGHGLGEDQVAVGEIDAEVFLNDGQVANAVTLVVVEGVFADGPRDVAGLPRAKRQRKKEKHHTPPHHSYSLRPVPGRRKGLPRATYTETIGMSSPGWKSTARYVALLATAFLVAVVGSWLFGVQLDNAAYDVMFRNYRPAPWKTQSVVLGIDEAALREFGGMPGMREPLARALRSVAAASPKAVAIDVILADRTRRRTGQSRSGRRPLRHTQPGAGRRTARVRLGVSAPGVPRLPTRAGHRPRFRRARWERFHHARHPPGESRGPHQAVGAVARSVPL